MPDPLNPEIPAMPAAQPSGNFAINERGGVTPPPMQYRVDLADLIHIADAATELDAARAFLVDQHSEQLRIGAIVERLVDLVEKAAGQHAHAIFGKEPA